MVVRPQGYLRNQAILSTLFGLQIVPNYVRPGVTFYIRGQVAPDNGALGAPCLVLKTGIDFDSASISS